MTITEENACLATTKHLPRIAKALEQIAAVLERAAEDDEQEQRQERRPGDGR